MSADNYYIIRKTPAGKFVALMAFMSDDKYPEVDPERTDYLTFDHPVDALLWAQEQPSEGGATLHPECGDLKISKSKGDEPWRPDDG